MINAQLKSLHAYWNRVRAGRLTPTRSELDPRSMGAGLGHVFILEKLGERNVRFRIAGTRLTDAFGMELRGLNARAVMVAAARESFSALVDEVLEDPGIGYLRLRDGSNPNWVWEMSLLPLRSDFGAIDRIVGCLHPLTDAVAGESRRPLRFSIDHMSIDSIIETAPVAANRDLEMAFAEDAEAFDHLGGVNRPERPFLRSIDGGLGGCGASADGEAPTRGHLRLVED